MDFGILSPVPTPNADGNSKDIDHSVNLHNDIQFVTPGETVTKDQQFVKGHGTYQDLEKTIIASVAGVVDGVNKVLSVRPLKTRYNPEIGDIIVGRVTEVGPRRWKVDINGRQDAILNLGSIKVPGAQRRKTELDQLQIRQFFAEGDALMASVQLLYGDGSVNLQTMNFGKLRNGSLLCVPPILVKRSATHIHSHICGVRLILGMNGFIWVQKTVEKLDATDELDSSVIYSDENDDISETERNDIARVSNCIAALAKQYMYIYGEIIEKTYEASLSYSPKELLKLSVIQSITAAARAKMRE